MDSKGEYLQSQGFDVKGSVERFCGDETMYYSFLARFTQDPNFSQISPALQAKDYQGALAAVHTLKGVAANLGMTPLYIACSQMVVLLRKPDYPEAEKSYQQVSISYQQTLQALHGAGIC